MTSIITYPSNIATDRDKLFAIYSLAEQFRLEHIRACKGLTPGAIKAYRKIYHEKIKWLLYEQAILRESIIASAGYTPQQWTQALRKKPSLFIEVLGNKQVLKTLPTLATYPLLDELKSVKVAGLEVPDPIEDFTTYTEADPTSIITVTSSRVTGNGTGNQDGWVVFDKGAGHFSADYEHLWELYITSNQAPAYMDFWAISNSIDNLGDWYNLGESYHSVEVATAAILITLIEGIGVATQYSDAYDGAVSILYYMTSNRDEAVGTYGTIYLYIDDSADRGSPLDTLVVTLHEKADFRHVFPLVFNDYTGGVTNGYSQNLDLQEVAGLSIPVAMHHYKLMRR